MLYRVRLEADQRALEQVRLQTEQAQRDMSAQVELQCAAELRKVQAAFDAEMQERAAALTAESEAREAAMRARLAEELERAKSLGNALEEERCARERFERERDALRRDIDMQRQAVASEQGVLQADREARLRKEFDDELQRMKSVLEQRVRSEEARRVEERREMEERHRAEERKLVAANAQLVEAEAKLRASSAEERAALEQAVANLKAAVKQSEGAARVRAAVEAERDRFQTRIAELEAERYVGKAFVRASVGSPRWFTGRKRMRRTNSNCRRRVPKRKRTVRRWSGCASRCSKARTAFASTRRNWPTCSATRRSATTTGSWSWKTPSGHRRLWRTTCAPSSPTATSAWALSRNAPRRYWTTSRTFAVRRPHPPRSCRTCRPSSPRSAPLAPRPTTRSGG